LDPTIPPPSDRKGKAKTRNQNGKKYLAAPSHEDAEEETPSRGAGRYAGLGLKSLQQRKGGLDEYEKALWNWVNVDDLDGFLQEVSSHSVRSTLTQGIRVL